MVEIKQATMNELNIVKDITSKTILTIYPMYYPKGAVDYFFLLHNNSIENDIIKGYVYIIYNDASYVGTVSIKENDIYRLYVLPKYQKNGYGNKLLDFAEELINQNYTEVHIDASLPAKNMYLKRGYYEISSNRISTETGDYLYYEEMLKSLSKIISIVNYNGKQFVPLINSKNGEVSSKTTFKYSQEGEYLTGTYSGGDIIKGTILGTVNLDGSLDFVYHHINNNKEFRVGKCHSVPHIMKDDTLELHEEWEWLNGDLSKGTSILVEKKD